MHLGADTAAIVSAVASVVYAAIAAVSLLLLSRQIRDARRFGAAPALYALLKELDEHIAAMQHAEADNDQAVLRTLDFFERVEHLRRAGVLPEDTLRRAFRPVLAGYLADPRFRRVIDQDRARHSEVLALARALERGRD